MMRHCTQTCRCTLSHMIHRVSEGLHCGALVGGYHRSLGRPIMSLAEVPATNDAVRGVIPLKALSPMMSPRADPSTSISSPPLAYEIIQGALVRGCVLDSCSPPPPTVVLVHGILGSRRNLQGFARRLMDGFPSWQAVLVDLRCHGASAELPSAGPHGVESCGRDVLELLSHLKVFPRVLIGHSFGGKVVMSMAQQFGQRLPRPVQAWVLDALPGEVRSGEEGRRDHPFDLIQTLKGMVLPVPSRSHLIDNLVHAGYSKGVASWMTTNLRPMGGANGRALTFTFDLDGVEEMYRSYESTSMWPLLTNPPEGLKLDFVRAERSSYRWGGQDKERIKDMGHGIHLLKNSGHWVHTDNPDGLFDIIESSMGTADLHMRRPGRVTSGTVPFPSALNGV
ncbi:hypothetical protein BSKO_04425 [Bryopsis sp. KO-2023]|nr:hypothetical protein BSKO_04425 [Bryopsis sp. KO-2023]